MTEGPKLVKASDLTNDELLELYAPHPETSGPWVRANFVVSVDGAIATNGSSGGLTSPLDQYVLKLLRDLSDVVLVGANTIRAEDYIGIRTTDERRQWRIARGRPPVPPIAVVSGSANIDPRSRLLTNTEVPPIILTTTTAPAEAKADLAAAGAEVIELGSGAIEAAAIIHTLAERGLREIVCEGGALLTGQLVADHYLNELCITTAPTVLGGTSARMTYSPQGTATAMTCQHIVFDADGAQLARWVRST
ncbi:pyrimidine reductase family protein [Nocardia vulneris]|uniref:Bacterial bifunctional deaminase-reductase C-terminal domain-containing protein n=1 Tax=Nocardia vulneris TaxID=1141657 RepID=A0ABR4Z5L1_9NOCA|nr:pyrimidine reductase family protein [Nocardia vulneris]KIA60564.1 hypothetical protein FG87_36225 [Nocardia vulneris]